MRPSHICRVRFTSSSSRSHPKFFRVKVEVIAALSVGRVQTPIL